MLTVIDEFTWECLASRVKKKLKSRVVLKKLAALL
jgi:hypothetical protein